MKVGDDIQCINTDSTSAMIRQIYPGEYAIAKVPELQDIQAIGTLMPPGTRRIKSR